MDAPFVRTHNKPQTLEEICETLGVPIGTHSLLADETLALPEEVGFYIMKTDSYTRQFQIVDQESAGSRARRCTETNGLASLLYHFAPGEDLVEDDLFYHKQREFCIAWICEMVFGKAIEFLTPRQIRCSCTRRLRLRACLRWTFNVQR